MNTPSTASGAALPLPTLPAQEPGQGAASEQRAPLQNAAALLRPPGHHSHHPAGLARLKDAGLEVEERRVRSRPNNKGAHHIIWFARKTR